MFFIGAVAGVYCASCYATNYGMHSADVKVAFRDWLTISDMALSPITVPVKLTVALFFYQ